MSQFIFGSGNLWAIPTITLAGMAVTTPTPVPFGILQDISVDMSFTLKELHGQYSFPVAIGRGSGKIVCKAKFGRITAALFNQVFGETPATGERKGVFEEAGTIPITPFAVTVANSATWVVDLGVKFALTGLPLTRVASGATPTTGQYKVTAGVYTFAAADTTLVVAISYIYTTAVAPGQVFTINNQLIGASPFFKAALVETYQGKNFTLELNRCVSNKLTMATKLEDFAIPEFDFDAMADDANVIGTYSLAE
jgi:hypothetical protein